MKKILMLVVLAGASLVLSGCGAETLTCTMSQEQTGMTMNQNVVVKFNNNEVTNLDMDIDVKLDDTYKAYSSTMKQMLESEFKNYEENGGKVDITENNNGLNVKVGFDLDKMSKEQKENLNLIDTSGTKAATQKDLEDAGYTCK